MTSLDVFDPAMCCSTGVCGPTVEPHLAQFEADLRWLSENGARVARRNLGQEPGAFAENTVVATILRAGGEDALPVILVDGRLKWTGHYPTRDELAAAVGIAEVSGAASSAGSACCDSADQSTDQSGGACCTSTTATGIQIGSPPAAARCC
jgi:hypothetical protein